MSDFITHVAAIAVGVLLTLLLVGGYNDATASPAVSSKKKATVTTAAKGGNDTNNDQKKKNRNKKNKEKAVTAVVAAIVESEENDDEEDDDSDIDNPTAFSEAELDFFEEEDKKKKKAPQQKKKENDKQIHIGNIQPATTFVENRFVYTMMALPKTVRVYILNFVGDTNKQEELRELPLVSKQFYKDCKELGLEWKLLPLFVLSAKDNNENNGRTLNFTQTMNQYQQDENAYRKLQRYSIFKVENIEQFDDISDNELSCMKMKGIRSLNISSLSSTTMVPMNSSLPLALSRIMPNLHELNLSGTIFNSGYILIVFSCHCHQLEKIAWTNININIPNLRWDGLLMKYARNLKEINMDDSNIEMLYTQEARMSDLNNHPTIYLFHDCGSTVLERVSIRNGKYHTTDNTSCSLSQNSLIKFIRNAPATLKWFRSNLTQENIEMMTSERPGIKLLN